MKKIQILRLVFENHFSLDEIPVVRAAIARAIPENDVLFHHHRDDELLLYHYPLIQYKLKGSRLMVTCIEQGFESFQQFMNLNHWTLDIHQQSTTLQVDRVYLNRFTLQVFDVSSTYFLSNWMALNEENYKKYFSTPALVERVQLLERILTAHILSFAKGVGWLIDKPIKVVLHDLVKERWSTYKGIQFFTPDILFSTNVSLPNDIGLGKAVSVGFGMVERVKNQANIPYTLNQRQDEPAKR
ncbi:MAG: hypothetical protein K6T34_08495 [Thermoflavifilum sp.]|nr:hypothetical protein [Thermoflavifilum sp.]